MRLPAAIAGSVFAAFATAFVLTTSADAWPEAIHLQIVVDASLLTPPALKGILQDHFDKLREGSIDPDRKLKDFKNHYFYPGGEKGEGPREIGKLAQEAKTALDKHQPMADVVYRLGLLGHYIADLYNPLATGEADPNEAKYYGEFLKFTAANLRNFRIRFQGYERDTDLQPAVTARAVASAQFSNRFYGNVKESFTRREGGFYTADYFGPQSVPFGVASICYSRAVSDVAKAWYSIWSHAGGDMTGAPLAAAPLTTKTVSNTR
ncbi:MAG: hypothetical protein HYV63_20305 [Candidatus Schekmanbacteria bacterium]|nr:hypothetical protein [Candidatus Schekmanbacteria bacterium]